MKAGSAHSAMFKKKQFKTEQAAIEEQAADWIIELEDGMTAERKAEFDAWRSADVRHEAAAQKLQQTWSRLSRLESLSPSTRSRPDPDLLAPSRWKRVRRPRTLLSVASATLAACLILAFTVLLLYREGKMDRGDTGMLVSTSAHDYSRINLDDGSVLEVNANSAVRVHYQDRVRLVELLQGEAHFEVRKDSLRPFVVKVDGIAFRAVGTAFNVRLDSREVKLLVTEGRVAVNKLHRMNGGREPVTETAERELETILPDVAAGQQVTLLKKPDFGEPEIHELDQAAIETALAWKGPRLFFDRTSIAEAVRQFNQQGNLRIRVEDPEIGSLRIGGSFLVSDVEAFLRLLEINNRIAIDRTSDGEAVIRPEQSAL